jgi:hypothetical protein
MKKFVSSKKFRYGKKKCCTSCHTKNLIYANWVLFSAEVISADDFYPNFPGDKVQIKIIRSHPRNTPPEKGEPFCLKILIFGNDDFFLEKRLSFFEDDDYYDRVHDTIQMVKRIPVPITKICLHLMGFRVE